MKSIVPFLQVNDAIFWITYVWCDFSYHFLDEVEKGSKKIKQLMSKGIPILPEKFLFQVEKGKVNETIKKLELVPTKSKVCFLI